MRSVLLCIFNEKYNRRIKAEKHQGRNAKLKGKVNLNMMINVVRE